MTEELGEVVIAEIVRRALDNIQPFVEFINNGPPDLVFRRLYAGIALMEIARLLVFQSTKWGFSKGAIREARERIVSSEVSLEAVLLALSQEFTFGQLTPEGIKIYRRVLKARWEGGT